MELIAIFVNEETKEGLYAVKYKGERHNEYYRLLESWLNSNYIREYLEINEEYLDNDFFSRYTFSELTTKVYREARELASLFGDAKESFLQGELKLQEIFWPLHDTQIIYPIHQKAKTSIKDWRFKRALLRLYAIRISENSYVITGGAVKLVKKMEDHPDTRAELKKMATVKTWLESVGLFDGDDLKMVEL